MWTRDEYEAIEEYRREQWQQSSLELLQVAEEEDAS